MSESGKRSRKSKLVPRADEEDLSSELQKPPKKKKTLKEVPTKREFDVKIEVEEFLEDFHYEEENNFGINEDSLTIKSEIKEESEKIEINNDTQHSDNDTQQSCNDTQQSYNDTQQSYNDTKSDIDTLSDLVKEEANKDMEPQDMELIISSHTISKRRRNLFLKIKSLSQEMEFSVNQCKLTEETVFSELDKLLNQDLSLIDKKLAIQVRNTWGRVMHVPQKLNYIDSQIQYILYEWMGWYGSGKLKGTPILYICYICSRGWWHLFDFREHLFTNHDTTDVKCNISINSFECYISAVGKNQLCSNQNIYVESNCWRCGREYEFHKPPNSEDNCNFYKCEFCNVLLSNCTLYTEHRHKCVQYRHFLKAKLPANTVLEFYRCAVCKMLLTSRKLLHQHYAAIHCVRSDLPITNYMKTCNHCNMHYADKLFHICPRRNYTMTCQFCMRRFPSRVMFDIHIKENYKKYYCNECDWSFLALCVETEHLVSHSSNFTIVYKCVTCEENIFLLDEESMKQHIVIWHKRFFDKRRRFVEMVVVPSNCISASKVERVDIVPSLTSRFEVSSTPNSVGVLEVSTVAQLDFKKKSKVASTSKGTKVATDDPECKIIENETDYVVIYDEYDQSGDENDTSTNESSINPANDALSNKSTVTTEENTIGDKSKENAEITTEKNKIVDESKENTKMTTEENMMCDESKENAEITTEKNKIVDESKENAEMTTEENMICDESKENSEITIGEAYTIYNIDKNTVDKEITKREENTTCEESISTDLTISTNSDKDSTQPLASIKIKVEKDYDIQESIHEVKNMFNTVVKTEPVDNTNNDNDEYANLLSKVFGGSYISSTEEIKIKTECEVEEIFENDIIDLVRNAECDTVKKKKKKNIIPAPSTSQGQSVAQKIKAAKKLGEGYKCSKCEKCYPDMADYIMHFPLHGYKENSCPACNETLTKKNNFIKHVQDHVRNYFFKQKLLETNKSIYNGNKVVGGLVDSYYTCKECKENVDVELLFSHWESHLVLGTKNNEFDTDDVPVRTSLGSDVLKQIKEILLSNKEPRIRIGDKTCHICDHEFARKNDHKRHLIEHLLEDALSRFQEKQMIVCQFCEKELVRPDDFRQHLRDHASLPVFRCVLCNKSFSDSSNFCKHKKTHNFLFHKCDVCGKKFHSKSMLEKHSRIHETNKPIKCACCCKTFYELTSYKKHVRAKSTGYLKFSCHICRKKFTALKDRWDHLWVVHKVRKCQADCPICSEPFRKYQDVRKHMREVHSKKVSFYNQKLMKVMKLPDEKKSDDQDDKDEIYYVFDEYGSDDDGNYDSELTNTG